MKSKQEKINYFNKASTLIALSIILGTVTYAWTGPTETAPNGNVPAPINVGNIIQTKIAGLNILGDTAIGTSSSPYSSFTIHGKGYSESTADDDGGHTIATKDYVDTKVSTGAEYGGMFIKRTNGSCSVLNPVSNTCGCSAGYSELYLNHFCETVPDTGNGCYLYLCSRSIPSVVISYPTCIDTFNSPGTYTCQIPEGVNSIKVTGTAGGGSGYNIGANPGGAWFYSGSGGGGVIDYVAGVNPGEMFTIIVGGVGSNTYLKRGSTGGVNIVSLGGGSNGGASQPSGGSGTLTGQNGSYQACGMYPRPLSGANSDTTIGSTYGFGGYSGCDGSSGSGGAGYMKISAN